MKSVLAALVLLCAVAPLHAIEYRGIVLAGDPVTFDASFAPRFTENQIRNTAEATRTGLARWASTQEGRRIIEYFAENGLVVNAIEDPDEEGLGRAPDPRLANLVAAAHHSRLRNFDLVLNPRFFRLPEGMAPLPNDPATPADAMAAAWAGEMLHVEFHARGIGLPHHERADFQEKWREVAAELGFPTMEHGGDEGTERRRPRVRWIGRR